MKYLLSIITLLLFSLQTTFAQNTIDDLKKDSIKLYVEYAAYGGYFNDSIYRSLGQGRLFIEKKGSIYTFIREPVDTFLKKFGESIKDEKIRKIVIDGMRKRNLEKELTHVYVKNYFSSDFFSFKSFPDKDVWISDSAVFKWKPVNEFKMVSGYKCQKATANNPKGEAVTAWFTEEIPISAGPMYFSGLPGLILEYHNSGNKSFYRAILISSTKIPEPIFRKWMYGPIISKSEFNEINQMGWKKFQQMKRMMENEKPKKQ